jgi:hypothetical protein
VLPTALAIITLLLLLAGIAGTVYFGVLPFHDFPRIVTGWVMMTLLAASALLLIWFGLALFHRSISFARPRSRVVVLAIWILALAIFVERPLADLLEGLEVSSVLVGSIYYLVISVAMGMALILSIVATVFSLILHVQPELKLTKWAKATLFVAALLLAISLRKFFFPSDMFATFDEIVSLAYRLDDILIYIWLTGMTWLFYREGIRGTNVSPQVRWFGILAGASLLFTVTAHWLYIPITFLAGWAALSYFIRPAEYWETIKSFFGPVVRKRLRLLDQVISLNAAEHSYHQYRKVLMEQLSKAEITFRQFEQRIKARKEGLDELSQKSRLNGRSVKDVALSFGPYETAWQNGLHGAKWALLLATPWIILGVADYLKAPMGIQFYAMWAIIRDLLSIVGRWVGIGFVFGYFFPYLRGKDGLQKGLGLFLVVFLPTLPLAAIQNVGATAWQATLFWGLQVFIHCMLLGLVAFDYLTVRKGYRDWQMLFEVHGIPLVGVSVSTILLAVGTTGIALLQGQATQLVALALKFILPQIPAIESVVK